MSVDKRKAPEAFGTTQLVKRTRPEAPPRNSVAVTNQFTNNGALIQAVMSNHKSHGEKMSLI
jgi:hypothetical protein